MVPTLLFASGFMNGPSLSDIFVINFTTKYKIAAQWRRFYLNNGKIMGVAAKLHLP
jgi:hypothetical protein